MQVLNLTQEQINSLPPTEREQIQQLVRQNQPIRIAPADGYPYNRGSNLASLFELLTLSTQKSLAAYPLIIRSIFFCHYHFAPRCLYMFSNLDRRHDCIHIKWLLKLACSLDCGCPSV